MLLAYPIGFLFAIIERRNTMQIHAIKTGTVAIKTRQQQGGRGSGALRLMNTMLGPTWTKPLPIYAWVIEHPEGVIVIDTGETARTAEPGYFPWWHPYFKLAVKEFVTPEEEIGPQLRTLGIPPQEVRWLIMTHLHTDHAGGLSHFPNAEILVSRPEYQLAAGLNGRLRGYLPNHWPDWFSPRLVDFDPQAVGPFPESFKLTRAGDVHLVPTPGHTGGHLSVIIEREGVSYFFAGDASYTEQTLLDQVVDGVSLDNQIAQQTLQRTLNYARQTPTIYLPSHDPDSTERLTTGGVVFPEGRPVPASAV
jgi:glyoxylase-like metal-dependent hydrolase (beta-lactamase superfamily II)